MFINEIVWCYTGKPQPNKLPTKHDIILRYGFNSIYNTVYIPYKFKDPRNKNYDRGKVLEDWWVDVPSQSTAKSVKESYPTQKPAKLLRRIICLGTR